MRILFLFCVVFATFLEWQWPVVNAKHKLQLHAPANHTGRLHKTVLADNGLVLSWLVDWQHEEVLFNIDHAFGDGTTKNRYFSIGFSMRGKIMQTDWCIFDSVEGTVVDAYLIDIGNGAVDDQQNCALLRFDDQSVAYKRKFDTCDPQDISMNEGTMYIMWSRSSVLTDDLIDFPSIDNHNGNDVASLTRHGMIKRQLLRSDKSDTAEDKKDIIEVEIRVHNVTIPSQDTTYWCKVQKLGNFIQNRLHIVEFSPILDASLIVHHMEVFQCDAPADIVIPLYHGDCDYLPAEAKVCAKVISLWARGASTFTYPLETGLPIGGKTFNPYIRLEVHYNNPALLAGHTDSSGMKIKMLSKLRKYDAAIMELGLEYTDKMAIPPGIVAFPLNGYCIPECTKIALPANGITVFGSQLHAHLLGARIITRHFRGGKELPELNRDDYFTQDYQEMRILRHRSHVLPGDALVTTCYYTSTSKGDNVTLGGFSIKDEMCVNYIHYYPATNLELCKSAVSEQALADFFQYMRESESQIGVNPGGARSHNYRAIEWTKPRVDQLFQLYTQSPLSMSCNHSDGSHYPGNWEGVESTKFELIAPNHQKRCQRDELFRSLEMGECGYLGDAECIY